jgi:uncharacterized protein
VEGGKGIMKISIAHLKDGIHNFNEDVVFAETQFYRKEVYPHPIRTNVSLNKTRSIIMANVVMDTTGHYTCDRCLEIFEKPVHIEFPLLIHIGENDNLPDEENVMALPEGTTEFEIDDWMIEYLVIDVPMKLLCKEDCKGLCAGCGAQLESEPCRCQKEDIDPRWEKLKMLRKQ